MKDKALLFLTFFVLVILALSLRGKVGNFTATDLLQPTWAEGGPFELSVERGRFALAFSLVENQSVAFSLPVARFATPDLGFFSQRYVSLFAPGLSILAVPGYQIGKALGAAQVGTYATISLFALANTLLIYLLCRRFQSSPSASILAAATFLLATPAFPYAVSFYQHHVSTFLILAGIYLLLSTTSLWSLVVIWFLGSLAILIDYPNLFLLFPIFVAAAGKVAGYKLQKGVLTFIPAIFPLAVFLWFNFASYGNPFQISGTVAQVRAIDANGLPTSPPGFEPENVAEFVNPNQQINRSPLRYFKPRNLVNGLYLQLLSPDRGIIYFTPVILVSILGIVVLYRRSHSLLPHLLAIVGLDVLLYAMWGDPWGGWAFGSRYLIPAYAILAVFLSIALTHFRKSPLPLLIFLILAVYSLAVNTAGAITSNANPPQVEVLALEKLSGYEQKYTYQRNFDHISAGRVKSVFFRELASRYLTPWQYYYVLVALATIFFIGLTVYLYVRN